MAGTMKTGNKCPEVVKTPTQYRGGFNKSPEVVKKPTPYTGGLNKAACDVPKKK
jgi:hypothetical protein